MHNILAVGCSDEQVSLLRTILNSQYNLLSTTSKEDTINIINNMESVLLLMNIDDPPFDTLEILDLFNFRTTIAQFPCLIITDDISKCPVEKAYQKGAIDYILYDMRPSIVDHKIKSILNTFKEFNPQVSSSNVYLFNNAIGPALIMKFANEEIDIMMINDEFFKLIGMSPEEYEANSNILFENLSESEQKQIRSTIRKAKKNRTAECVTTNQNSGQYYLNTFRYINSSNHSDYYLIILTDITEHVHREQISDAMMRLPGTVMFDYETSNDRIVFYVGEAENSFEISTESTLENDKLYNWLAPEYGKAFRKAFRKTIKNPSPGYQSMDIRAAFGGSIFRWYRMFFQPVMNHQGIVTRIIGRVDNLEGSTWVGVKDQNRGLCDVETHLLTYHAFHSYMQPFIDHSSSGTLLLIDIDGLSTITQLMKTDSHTANHQILLQMLAEKMKAFFDRENIVGRYSQEGFLIFLPETLNVNDAVTQSMKLIDLIRVQIHSYTDEDFGCNIGISLPGNQTQISIDKLMVTANLALFEAKAKGQFACAVSYCNADNPSE